MEKRETKKIINSLMDLPEFEPERVKVKVTRLNMVFELQELPYDKLVKLSREADANIHLILACVCNHPEIKRGDWYHDKMKCAPAGRGGQNGQGHRHSARIRGRKRGPRDGG